MSSSLPASKSRRLVFRCLLAAGSFLFAFLLAEVAVRLIGTTDADGNFFFRGAQVGRRIPPVTSIAATLDKYQHTNSTRMVYDAETGWKPRPHISTHNGDYRYNSVGIRSQPKEFDLKPAAGVLRIALFGDSFTHGDDVPFDETWGAQLEAILNESGTPAEVINFGVSAYGMDQAYLRWQTFGKKYSPHIVLFGFQAENVNRNVNMLRAFYAGGTGIPFSKPRFLRNEADALQLINSPTLALDQIPHVMANMETWDLARHETFYDRRKFAKHFWDRSRVISLAVSLFADDVRRRRIQPFRLDSEPARVTRALLRDFESEVESNAAKFVIVHLPTESDLKRLLNDRGCAYEQLLEQVAEQHRLIDPQPELLKAAQMYSLESLFQRHYSARGNRIIAEVIAMSLIDLQVDNEITQSPQAASRGNHQ